MIAVVQTPCDKIVRGDANGDCKFDVEDLDVFIQYYNGDVGSLRYEEIHKTMMDMDMNSKMNTIVIACYVPTLAGEYNLIQIPLAVSCMNLDNHWTFTNRFNQAHDFYDGRQALCNQYDTDKFVAVDMCGGAGGGGGKKLSTATSNSIIGTTDQSVTKQTPPKKIKI